MTARLVLVTSGSSAVFLAGESICSAVIRILTAGTREETHTGEHSVQLVRYRVHLFPKLWRDDHRRGG
ncbi:hypothetical protein NQZ68_002049 [Dissostichus eleginoides]|nr:hypothetical protein NQZ68_002049 [Dissostichus eleginoides]